MEKSLMPNRHNSKPRILVDVIDHLANLAISKYLLTARCGYVYTARRKEGGLLHNHFFANIQAELI